MKKHKKKWVPTEHQKNVICVMENLAFTEVIRMVCKQYGLPLSPDKPEEIEERELMKRWIVDNDLLLPGADVNEVIMKVAKEMRHDNDGPYLDERRYQRLVKEQREKEQKQQ
jgi:hypothetical protein